jgi:hypothetical protein
MDINPDYLKAVSASFYGRNLLTVTYNVTIKRLLYKAFYGRILLTVTYNSYSLLTIFYSHNLLILTQSSLYKGCFCSFLRSEFSNSDLHPDF